MEKKMHNHVLLHIPHASTVFPAGSQHGFKDLDEDERLLIDYYTDELFSPVASTERIRKMAFPYCRLYCDAERLVNDPLEKVGLGISYHRQTDKGRRLFGSLPEAFAIYADFHAKMAKEIVNMGVGTLLIDCHSFSNLPNMLNSTPSDIDICIGFNDDETCPNKVVIGNIVHYFKSKGYEVGINEPFSNSKTFAVPVEYHSVMIEVNKRLYMNERTLEKTEGFDKLKHEIQVLYTMLLKEERELNELAHEVFNRQRKKST